MRASSPSRPRRSCRSCRTSRSTSRRAPPLPREPRMSLLALERVKKVFGGLSAVRDLDLAIEPGSIFGLIGPNGAGKTTIFNVITGVYKPDGGRIRFDGEDIGGWAPAAVAARGIARTFQNIRLFRSMTVE